MSQSSGDYTPKRIAPGRSKSFDLVGGVGLGQSPSTRRGGRRPVPRHHSNDNLRGHESSSSSDDDDDSSDESSQRDRGLGLARYFQRSRISSASSDDDSSLARSRMNNMKKQESERRLKDALSKVGPELKNELKTKKTKDLAQQLSKVSAAGAAGKTRRIVRRNSMSSVESSQSEYSDSSAAEVSIDILDSSYSQSSKLSRNYHSGGSVSSSRHYHSGGSVDTGSKDVSSALMNMMHQSSMTIPVNNIVKSDTDRQRKSTLKTDQIIESIVWFSFHTPRTVLEDLISHELELWRRDQTKLSIVRSRHIRKKKGFTDDDITDGSLSSLSEDGHGANIASALSDMGNFSENLMRLQNSSGGNNFMTLPKSSERESALLFVDMSGFTKLSTMLDVESLSKVINAYFDMIVTEVINYGGDILKFAGDAFFAEWRLSDDDNSDHGGGAKNPLADLNASLASVNEFGWDDDEDIPKLSTCALMAARCAVAIVSKYSDYHVTSASANKSEAMLNVHCGLGVGRLSGLHVGDFKEDQEEDAVELRREFLILGDPIEQVSKAAEKAICGEVYASPEAMLALSHCCEMTDEQRITSAPVLIALRNETYIQFESLGDLPQALQPYESLRMHCKALNHTALARLHLQMALYVHPVIRGDELALSAAIQAGKISQPTATLESRHRAEAELRSVFTIFLKPIITPRLAGMKEIDKELYKSLADIMHVTSRELDRYSGHLRQFIVDDKGVVLIATFGLRGSTFPNMVANNALPATFAIHRALKTELNVESRIGATYGKVYCGVVGGLRRHEFAVMGAPVNLAARLMGNKVNKGILVDEAVAQQAGTRYSFVKLPPVQAKGYDKPVPIFEPLPATAIKKKKVSYPFTGRKEEKRSIVSVANSMLVKTACQSSMVFLMGESGVGKSALAAAVVEEIRKENCVEGRKIIIAARSTSNETQQRIPLSSFRQVFLSLIRDHCEFDGTFPTDEDNSAGQRSLGSTESSFGGLSLRNMTAHSRHARLTGQAPPDLGAPSSHTSTSSNSERPSLTRSRPLRGETEFTEVTAESESNTTISQSFRSLKQRPRQQSLNEPGRLPSLTEPGRLNDFGRKYLPGSLTNPQPNANQAEHRPASKSAHDASASSPTDPPTRAQSSTLNKSPQPRARAQSLILKNSPLRAPPPPTEQPVHAHAQSLHQGPMPTEPPVRAQSLALGQSLHKMPMPTEQPARSQSIALGQSLHRMPIPTEPAARAQSLSLGQSLHRIKTNDLRSAFHRTMSVKGTGAPSVQKSLLYMNKKALSARSNFDESSAASMDASTHRQAASVPYFEKLCWVCEKLDYPYEYADIVGSQFLGLESANPVTHVDGHVPTMDELVEFLALAFICVTEFADLSIVVLDDFQWADAFSWKIFRVLCKRGKKMLLICATRSHDKQALRRLSTALSSENQLASQMTEISLGPLDFSEIRELIALVLDVDVSAITESLCTDIFQRTGGLPVFVVQVLENIRRKKTLELADGVLKWTAEGLKEKKSLSTVNNASMMEQTFLSRFDALDVRVRKVLQTCAVLGLKFALTDVIQVHPEISESDIENALDTAVDEMILVEHVDDDEDTTSLRSGSLVDDDDNTTVFNQSSSGLKGLDDRFFQFSHAMWRNNVLTTMLQERKIELHRLIAESMERDQVLVLEQSDISRLLTLFDHWKSCGDFCKSAPLALAVGARLEEWDLSAQSLELYEDALELSFDSVFNAGEEKDGESEWVKVKAKPMVLDLILRLHICIGLCHQRLNDPQESTLFFEDAFSIIKSASKVPGMSKSLMMPIISSLCVLKLDDVSSSHYGDEQENLVTEFVAAAHENGHPVHICRAFAVEATRYAKIGQFNLAVECVDKILAIYDVERHGADMIAEYGSDFALAAIAESVQWLYLAEQPKRAEKQANMIMDELLPLLDTTEVDDTMAIVLPVIQVLMLLDRARDADWLLKNFIINPYHESGQETYWSPFFNPLAYVLELVLMEEADQYDEEILADLETWVLDEESAIYDIELERKAHTLMGELCWRLAYNKADEDPSREVLLEKAREFLTPVARYPHSETFLKHTARALLEAL